MLMDFLIELEAILNFIIILAVVSILNEFQVDANVGYTDIQANRIEVDSNLKALV